ncbi:MAG: hypothetical protein RDU20_00025 [Desulfomonilaceae bacterium]|nr:hypothetical protein [Desulfomonilaceae bacterium]
MGCRQKVNLQKPCGQCRCPELMQMVTLTGYTAGQVNLRTPIVPEATVTTSVLPAVFHGAAHVDPVIHEPKNTVLLKTCTLLI